MGERIHNLRLLIRVLQKIEPKHSFVHLVVNLLLGVTCITLAAIGEIGLWKMFVVAFGFSVLVYVFRLRRFSKRKKRDWLKEYEEATGMKVEVD